MSVSYLLRLAVTGSVCPSSAHLAQTMAEIAAEKRFAAGELVFVGIGNGVIAKEFLHWNQPVTFIDIERGFCDAFARTVRLDRHRVVCADVVDFLSAAPDAAGRLVVSCLPMHGPYFSAEVAGALVREVRRGARLVFYSYFPFIRGTRLARFLDAENLVVCRERTVLRNFPPAYVYSIGQATGHPRR